MKKTLLTVITTLCFFAGAIAQITVPRPSPEGSVYSKVGLTDVTIEYFRPKVKDRKIFGEGSDFLQPYGDVWRTGANSGSKLILSTEVDIAGTKVPAGEYLIFTVPGKDQWEFMLYSDLSIGGNTSAYNKEKEVVRTSVKPVVLSNKVETLTFNIADISDDNTTAHIQMAWDNVAINVPFKVDFDAAVMKDIEANTQVNPNNYVAAANYYYSAGKDLNKALEWINMYLAQGENSKQFWNVYLKAQILAKMGKKKEAIAAAQESMAAAKAYPQGDFGYVKRNEDLIASLK